MRRTTLFCLLSILTVSCASAMIRNCDPNTELKCVYIEFKYPYADKTGYYRADDTITFDVSGGADINADVGINSYAGMMQTRLQPISIAVPKNLEVWDYLCDNLYFLLIAYAAVMAYRFFSGRALDFKDMIDEYKGKK